MKKMLMLFTALLILSGMYASVTVINPHLKANEIYFEIGKSGKIISLIELSQIKLKDFEKLTDRKMKFIDRLTFRISQKKLRNSINNDGSFNKKKIEKFFSKSETNAGFNAGGFFLGLLLGLIGVLIAYLIKDEKKKNRVKWAWIGFATWVAIFIIWASTGSFTLF